MTSTMKSETSRPVALASSVGVPVSAAAITVPSLTADGSRAASDSEVATALAPLRRYRGGSPGDGDAGHEFAATDIRALRACQILAWHEFLQVVPRQQGARCDRSVRREG